MSLWWPSFILVGVVGVLLRVSRHPAFQPVFRWLPVPLWCYGLPMVLRATGWLPATSPAYTWTTTWLLPVALGLLLFGVDLASVWRLSAQALIAMLVGALAIGGNAVGTYLGLASATLARWLAHAFGF